MSSSSWSFERKYENKQNCNMRNKDKLATPLLLSQLMLNTCMALALSVCKSQSYLIVLQCQVLSGNVIKKTRSNVINFS